MVTLVADLEKEAAKFRRCHREQTAVFSHQQVPRCYCYTPPRRFSKQLHPEDHWPQARHRISSETVTSLAVLVTVPPRMFYGSGACSCWAKSSACQTTIRSGLHALYQAACNQLRIRRVGRPSREWVRDVLADAIRLFGSLGNVEQMAGDISIWSATLKRLLF